MLNKIKLKKYLGKQTHDYHDSLSTLHESDEGRVNSTNPVVDLNGKMLKTPLDNRQIDEDIEQLK